MARDDLGELVAQPLDGAAVIGGEGLVDGGFVQVAQQPVLGEELVAAGGPGVDLAEPSQVAVAVPAELGPGSAAVRGCQVTGGPFPGSFAVVAGRQGLQQQQSPGHGQDLRGGQVPAGGVRVGDEPDVGEGPAGQAAERGDPVGPAQRAQLLEQDSVAGVLGRQCPFSR
jgi:hypothetical protein